MIAAFKRNYEKSIQDFGCKALGKKTTWETSAQVEYNSKMDLKEGWTLDSCEHSNESSKCCILPCVYKSII
jgi:hypothetical protein